MFWSEDGLEYDTSIEKWIEQEYAEVLLPSEYVLEYDTATERLKEEDDVDAG